MKQQREAVRTPLNDVAQLSFRACGPRNLMKAVRWQKCSFSGAKSFVLKSAVIAAMRLSTQIIVREPFEMLVGMHFAAGL